MAVMKILGSSSDGNCYLIETKTGRLLIELGFMFPKIKEFLGFDLENITAIVTHEHKDHSKGVIGAIKIGIEVFATEGTFDALGVKRTHKTKAFNKLKVNKCGSFDVIPFDVNHDCAEPVNFLIRHEEFGVLLFVTDTYYLNSTFKGLNHIIIEANYSNEIIKSKQCLYTDRVIRSHMSLETCIETLQANDLSNVKTITLCHLSNSNSNAIYFRKRVMQATGIPVEIADEGIEIELD